MSTAIAPYPTPLFQPHQLPVNTTHGQPLKRLRKPQLFSKSSSPTSSRPQLPLLPLSVINTVPSPNYSVPALRRVIARLDEANNSKVLPLQPSHHVIIPVCPQVSSHVIEKKLIPRRTNTTTMLTAVFCAAGVVAIGASYIFSPLALFAT